MTIEVNGNNNRVAGRDYLELNAQVTLTPEQLKHLAIRPCPTCEQRVLTGAAKTCNHCLREQLAAQHKFYGSVVFFLVFVIWGWLLQGRDTRADPWQFLETLMGACGIVFFGALLLGALRHWWRSYSER